MTTRNMMYDSPVYVARQMIPLGVTAAGAAAVTSKFIAFANLLVFSITATQIAVGSSTYTGWNGTATVTAVGADTFSVIRVFNTNTALGTSPGLGTATYGPFVSSLYNGTQTGTQTNSSLPGYSVNVPLSGTATGTGTVTGQMQAGSAAATGGFPVNQGDQLYIVRGTDTTATANFALEYAVAPFANVTA